MTSTVVLSDVDYFGKLIPWQGTLPNSYQNGLNLGAGTFGASETRTSNIIQLSSQALIEMLIKLASGDLTVKLSIFDVGGSANFGSPDLTITSSDTNKHYDYHELASGKLFQLQAASTGGCVLSTAFCRPSSFGEDFRVLSYGWAAVNQGVDPYADAAFAVTA